MPSPNEIIRSLQEQIRQVAVRPPHGRVTSGSKALDRLFADEGFQRGTLVEWLGPKGCGATTLAMIAAREACRDGRVLVVVDGARRFYPPAAATYGIGWENLIIVRPQKQKDYEWALNQSLHCPAVSAVVCWPEELGSRAYRRLQLAAETGGSLGLLIRPEGAVNKPSWADVRLSVRALPTTGKPRIKVELLRCRGGQDGRSVELELDDETHTLHLAPELAVATPARRSAET